MSWACFPFSDQLENFELRRRLNSAENSPGRFSFSQIAYLCALGVSRGVKIVEWVSFPSLVHSATPKPSTLQCFWAFEPLQTLELWSKCEIVRTLTGWIISTQRWFIVTSTNAKIDQYLLMWKYFPLEGKFIAVMPINHVLNCLRFALLTFLLLF